jgi:hypothetical protein
MDPKLVLFYRQYLQQVDDLTYPPGDLLLDPSVQEQVSLNFFDPEIRKNLPPGLYQRKVSKTLVERIEAAIKDPDEDVCVLTLP